MRQYLALLLVLTISLSPIVPLPLVTPVYAGTRAPISAGLLHAALPSASAGAHALPLSALSSLFHLHMMPGPSGPNIFTIAGGGPNNIPAIEANIANPSGVAVDGNGNIYIS